jgi:hypothetical protein
MLQQFERFMHLHVPVHESRDNRGLVLLLQLTSSQTLTYLIFLNDSLLYSFSFEPSLVLDPKLGLPPSNIQFTLERKEIYPERGNNR